MLEQIPMTDEAANRQLEKNGPLLLELYDSSFAMRPPAAEWERAALGCLARAQYTLRTLLALDRAVDRVVLARVVYEFTLTMAWICVEPERHFGMLLCSERLHREKALKDIASFGVDVGTLDVVELVLAGAGDKPVPKIGVQAVEADEHWRKAEGRWRWHFRRSYSNFYRYASAYAHPLPGGLGCFLTKPPIGPFVLSDPDTGDGEVAAAHAVLAFADALVVATHRFGWPTLPEITKAIATGRVKERE